MGTFREWSVLFFVPGELIEYHILSRKMKKYLKFSEKIVACYRIVCYNYTR